MNVVHELAALKHTIHVGRIRVSRGVIKSGRADLLRRGEAFEVVICVRLLADDDCAHNGDGAVREGH